MRRAVLGALAGACLAAVVIGLCGWHGQVLAQRVTPLPQAGGELIAVPASLGDRGQMLTVVDPRQQAICVYTIDAATGRISLRSTRNIRYDLQMTDFNGDNPLPREIRLQLEQR